MLFLTYIGDGPLTQDTKMSRPPPLLRQCLLLPRLRVACQGGGGVQGYLTHKRTPPPRTLQ